MKNQELKEATQKCDTKHWAVCYFVCGTLICNASFATFTFTTSNVAVQTSSLTGSRVVCGRPVPRVSCGWSYSTGLFVTSLVLTRLTHKMTLIPKRQFTESRHLGSTKHRTLYHNTLQSYTCLKRGEAALPAARETQASFHREWNLFVLLAPMENKKQPKTKQWHFDVLPHFRISPPLVSDLRWSDQVVHFRAVE